MEKNKVGCILIKKKKKYLKYNPPQTNETQQIINISTKDTQNFF